MTMKLRPGKWQRTQIFRYLWLFPLIPAFFLAGHQGDSDVRYSSSAWASAKKTWCQQVNLVADDSGGKTTAAAKADG